MPESKRVYFGEIDSPLGGLAAAVNEDGALMMLHFLNEGEALTSSLYPKLEINGYLAQIDPSRCAPVALQLGEYFDGRRRHFDLPLAPLGTAFQKQVWAELLRIPFGEAISYGQLASRIGNPKACRGVGSANGANPIAVIVPCHRVIGADRTLTGYAGGLERKRWLLQFEGVHFKDGRKTECQPGLPF